MSKNILGFRLRTGEDVIGSVEDELGDGTYVLSRPAVPINQPEQENGLMMLKWAPFADQEEFTFYKEDYVGLPYKVWKQLEDFYLESTSRIQLASAANMPKSKT